MTENLRRNFLKKTALSLGAVSFSGKAITSATLSPSKKEKKRLLRIAHLTDVHVFPNKTAESGMAKALQVAQSLTDKPDVIFNGGDCIMDSLKKTKEETKAQWDVWQQTLKNELSIKMVSCIGNHDVWGWSNVGSKKKHDPLYGKQWAVEELKLPNKFYSMDINGVHIVALDSTHYRGLAGYWARLDEEQMDWLKSDLQKTPQNTPVCVLSHIPILSVCTLFDGENLKRNNWNIPGAWMHQDAKELKDLFYKHPQVKLCLSGHIHLIDECEYLGVTYYCNGAVSGAWWGGKLQEFPPAFAVINIYDNGSSEREIVYY